LSLYTSEDYAKAGVPMLPVVKGAKHTRLEILIYSLILIPVCQLPALTGLGGPIYLAVSGLGGAIFLLLALRLLRSHAGDAPDPRLDAGLYDVRVGAKTARNLFAFSILYLFLMFAALLAERTLGLLPFAPLPFLEGFNS
jgi:protoheme IX farnesyltransferase